MVSVLILLSLALGITTLTLTVKIYLMKKSAKEICRQLGFVLAEETNTLICISSNDPSMKRLAAEINQELRLLRKERRRYLHGDRELKEAVTNISHDLRTPLTAIYGYLNLLKKEECPEHIKRYLDAIENRAQALKQLTEELFRYTIVISEAEEMTLQVLTLNGILESSISAYYSVLKQNHIVPEISISDQQITGRVNENALSRVLGNILSNAVKYSDGDLKIVLSEDGEIRISNHASGLSEVQAERLFDRFYTVNTARKSTGLGLSIAKALMEKMGGTITADYRENVLEICVNVQKL